MIFKLKLKVDVWCVFIIHLKTFLAAISSSRSDSVTKFVRSSVRSFVRLFVRPLFLILKFSCSLKPTMLSKLLTIVLGVKLHEMNISKALKFQFEAEN